MVFCGQQLYVESQEAFGHICLCLYIHIFRVFHRFPVLTQPEAAILESHGIEVPSPSCHSNGEEGEMQEFADQVNHRFSEQVSQLGAT